LLGLLICYAGIVVLACASYISMKWENARRDAAAPATLPAAYSENQRPFATARLVWPATLVASKFHEIMTAALFSQLSV
jgi:hypothetical protein